MSFDLVNDVLNEISESFFGMVHGFRNKHQKVIASMNGTINIIHIVFTGETPIEIRAAYEKLPKIPAPPVPLDQVLITNLQSIRKYKMAAKLSLCIHNKLCVETYLWNFAEYAKSDTSPRPELNEVKATPPSAIQSSLAKATIRKPIHCVKHATNIRMLCTNKFNKYKFWPEIQQSLKWKEGEIILLHAER